MKNHIVLNNVMNLGDVDSISNIIYNSIMKPNELLRPLAIKIEGNSGKELITTGIEDGNKPFRRWSKFNQIDIVEMKNNNRIIKGKYENSASYADRIFIFDNENNLNLFLTDPRNYVS
jgi:hypothetical protein